METLRWDLTFLSAEMLVPPMPGDGKHPGLDVSLPTEGGNGPDHLHKTSEGQILPRGRHGTAVQISIDVLMIAVEQLRKATPSCCPSFQRMSGSAK